MATFKGLTRNCVVCGTEYRSPQSHARVLTCSRECGYKARTVVNKKEPVEKPCAHCGKVMLLSPSHEGRRRYCSHACKEASPSTVARKVAKTGGANPAWRGGTMIKSVSKTGKEYRRQHPHIENEKAVRRKRVVAGATPSWVDAKAVLAVYAAARKVSKETGVPHHVDHVVPLTSKLVCGLHVQNNLAVKPGVENLKKHNRTWPDMP